MIADLIGRLEAGQGADRELDASVWALSLPATGMGVDGYGLPEKASGYEYDVDERGGISMYVRWPDGKANKRAKVSAPALTASLDAALAFAEAVLPGMNCHGYEMCPGSIEAYVSRNNVSSGHWLHSGEHKSSIPRAILIAVLRALQSQEPTP